MDGILDELQRILTPLALAAFTAFLAWAFATLHAWFGIQKSDANEEAIRRAAATEAGKLIVLGTTDLIAVDKSVAKIKADLPKQVASEGYNAIDLADMVVANFLPPGISQAASLGLGIVKGLTK